MTEREIRDEIDLRVSYVEANLMSRIQTLEKETKELKRQLRSVLDEKAEKPKRKSLLEIYEGKLEDEFFTINEDNDNDFNN